MHLTDCLGLKVSTIVRFFTFAIVDIYRKWVLISRNFAKFRNLEIPRKFEISISSMSEFREIFKFR